MFDVIRFHEGVRHLVWDRDPDTTLNNDDVHNTSRFLIVSTVLASLMLAAV